MKTDITSSSIVVRIYETVRLLDEYYANNKNDESNDKSLFSDPLVSIRTASVYYRHFGSFRRSTQLYKEAAEMVDKLNENYKDTVILTKEYIENRIAENSWTAYYLDGHQPNDLRDARINAYSAYSNLIDNGRFGDKDVKLKEMKKKLPSLILTIELAYARQERCIPTVFGVDGKKLWDVIEDVYKHIAKYKHYNTFVDTFTELERDEEINSKGLRQQGIAIWKTCQVYQAIIDNQNIIADPEDAVPARRNLESARNYIRRGHKIVAQKVRENHEGAIPFHEDCARDVEEFIYSLSVDDIINKITTFGKK